MTRWDVQFKRDYGQASGQSLKQWLEPYIEIPANSYPRSPRGYDERRAVLVVFMRTALEAIDEPTGNAFYGSVSSLHEQLQHMLEDTTQELDYEGYLEGFKLLQDEIAAALENEGLATDWVYERTGRITNVSGEAVQVMIDSVARNWRYNINPPKNPHDHNALVWAHKER